MGSEWKEGDEFVSSKLLVAGCENREVAVVSSDVPV